MRWCWQKVVERMGTRSDDRHSGQMSAEDVMRGAQPCFIEDPHPWQAGRVSARIVALRANNPSPMTYTGTNSYVVAEPGSRGCVVIDPAPAGKQVQNILSQCNSGGLQVKAIVVTHDHHDHTEGVHELAQATGAAVFAPKALIAADTPDGAIRVDGVLKEGTFCPFEGAPTFEIVALPGHSHDSIGLLLAEEKALFVGDVVFRHGPTVVFFPDGNLRDYLQSLDVIEKMVLDGKVSVLYPAHGWPITDPLCALRATRNHRLERLQQIKDALAAGTPPDADKLFDVVYAGVDEKLRWASLRSIKAQLVYLGYPQTLDE